jgi:ribosomal protein S18 acetylase RimI-like enzyme
MRSSLPVSRTWLSDEQYPQVPELTCEETLQCFQMVLSADLSAPSPTIDIVPLSTANAQKMVDLTTLAFPGFFRSRTCEMGSYNGVRSPSGELIAMGGERLQLDGYSEISAVCTHLSFRGQGFAARLIWHLVRNHRCDGLVSWFHVGCANHRAVKLYLGMGFQQVRKVTLHRLSRKTL